MYYVHKLSAYHFILRGGVGGHLFIQIILFYTSSITDQTTNGLNTLANSLITI